MTTTRDDIAEWFKRGVDKQATHMLVICDTFDWSDYPVYCSSTTEAKAKAENPGGMQKTMEVYNLEKDMVDQLEQLRCFEF